MTSMIERVARALARDFNTYHFDRGDSEAGWQDHINAARAAIEAMRDPTPALHVAANEISVYYDDFSCGDGNITLGIDGYPDKFNRVWSGLIDAALRETTA